MQLREQVNTRRRDGAWDDYDDYDYDRSSRGRGYDSYGDVDYSYASPRSSYSGRSGDYGRSYRDEYREYRPSRRDYDYDRDRRYSRGRMRDRDYDYRGRRDVTEEFLLYLGIFAFGALSGRASSDGGSKKK